MPELYQQVERALLQSDAAKKCTQTLNIFDDWQAGSLGRDSSGQLLEFNDPGRPQRPHLVEPRRLGRRSFSSSSGRIMLLHAIAHIEFNAINIALDAVYRFREMPENYISDWLRVASEEAHHFTLLDDELKRRDSFYGAFDAHRGLWDMVCKTREDVLHRMALVPRVMEARGLDVTPAMIKKLSQVGDIAAVSILQTIYQDEIDHVRIGNVWYRWLCSKRQIDPQQTFRKLIHETMDGKLRGPFNWPARLEAGFDEAELAMMESEFG